jgi:hypothetical protein
MSRSDPNHRYQVLPLPIVQKDAKKKLSASQLREGIGLAKRLRHYPEDHGLKYEPCGDGLELKIESPETPEINKQGWLRAIFWVFEARRTIYVIDLFWKKENRISKADLHRANHRIRLLKEQLRSGKNPWKSGK